MSKENKNDIYINWLRQAASRHTVEEEYYQHAWKVAKEAARLLRKRYKVSRVRVFGSLIHKERFHDSSDVDLAIEGLKPEDYWDAVTSVLFLDSRLQVEIIDQATCNSEIWEVVEREGIDL